MVQIMALTSGSRNAEWISLQRWRTVSWKVKGIGSEKNILVRYPRLSRNVCARETREGKTWFSRLEGDMKAIISRGIRACGNNLMALRAAIPNLKGDLRFYSSR